jgi:hypothetical protein
MNKILMPKARGTCFMPLGGMIGGAIEAPDPPLPCLGVVASGILGL